MLITWESAYPVHTVFDANDHCVNEMNFVHVEICEKSIDVHSSLNKFNVLTKRENHDLISNPQKSRFTFNVE